MRVQGEAAASDTTVTPFRLRTAGRAAAARKDEPGLLQMSPRLQETTVHVRVHIPVALHRKPTTGGF